MASDIYDVDGLEARISELQRELSQVSAAVGSVRWMDHPDGGSVSLAEQVGRMRADLERVEGVNAAQIDALKMAFFKIVGLSHGAAVQDNGWQWPEDDDVYVDMAAEQIRALIARADQ